MSIEIALANNTLAINNLAASLKAFTDDVFKVPKAEHIKVMAEEVLQEKVKHFIEAEKKVEKKAKVAETAPVEKVVNVANDAAFSEVRALVLKLAPTKRAEIKAINEKHEIAKISQLLTKEDDDTSLVKDPAKLNAIYADLLALVFGF